MQLPQTDPKDTPDVSRIVNVLNAFARMADEGTVAQMGELLADDVEWHMTGTAWRGHTEVLEGLGGMRALGHAGPGSGNRHIVTNQEVYVEAEHARAFSSFLLVSWSPVPPRPRSWSRVPIATNCGAVRTADGCW
ncbi:nuclear transport factor 2 family protein [Streptomyces sp. HD]|uniref:nuclear transport factor 2 family protein n=1 Tax=Streptomyces sp. HD TaxID=3020892 RepID=UPI00232C428C|nr:nuclear transport factor 2 family protein [Streptomyces sp. HD]MDC0770822.1 nuclear transport factor 2 family protein [Streptomyces sp. HD]